jgi:hypothetical protein
MAIERTPRLRRVTDPNEAVGELHLAATLYILGYVKLAQRGKVSPDEILDTLREVRDELVTDRRFRRTLTDLSRKIGIPDSSRSRAFAEFASRSDAYIGQVKGAIEDNGE